jgi:hypothetical protein
MWLRLAVPAFALAASALAWGQTPEPPERLLRPSYLEGEVELRVDDQRPSPAQPDRPLMRGDRLVTHSGARAELLLDASPIRLDEDTELRVDALKAMSVQLRLDRGVANVRLRELYEGERFEIALSNVRVVLREPGEYRIEARAEDISVLTVLGGAAEVATAAGLVRVAGGQRVVLEGRDSRATLVPSVAADAFDDWVLEREVQLASVNEPAGPDEAAYEQAGRWYDDASYGHVWMADYSYGAAPWLFFAFSSGRWAYLPGHGRWCWSPPRPSPVPIVAQETRPFGPRAVGSRGVAGDGTPMMPGTRSTSTAPRGESSVRRWSFGSSSRSSGSATQGHTATMRPSGSSSRSRSSSSSSTSSRSSVFAVPTSP